MPPIEMFDEITGRFLTPSTRTRLLLVLPAFAVAALVAASGFASFILTESLAGLTVMGFLFGYPVLFVVEAVGIFLRYDDPLPKKFAIVGMLFVVAVVTWMAAIFVGLRALPFHT